MNVVEFLNTKLKDKIVSLREKRKNRIYLEFRPEDVVEIVRVIFNELGCRFITATALEIPLGFEIIYHFSYDTEGIVISGRTQIKDKQHPELDSITPLIKGAEWIEREIWELLGISFRNHPNLRHLLLPDDWPEGNYPLRQNR